MGGGAYIWPYSRNGENQNLQMEKIYQTFIKKVKINFKNTPFCPEFPQLSSKLKRFKRNFIKTFSGCLPPPKINPGATHD
jgi:hypothetical protein